MSHHEYMEPALTVDYIPYLDDTTRRKSSRGVRMVCYGSHLSGDSELFAPTTCTPTAVVERF